jgi:hypothetical protein
MTTDQRPTPIVIPDGELLELENAVGVACSERHDGPFAAHLDVPTVFATHQQPFYMEDSTGAMVVSFDKYYHPFCCDTRG